jgi:hypothetical protein
MNIHSIYDILFSYFRPRRLRLLYDTFQITSDTRIIDIGGTSLFWRLAANEGLPVPQVTLANIDVPEQHLPKCVTLVRADGTCLPFSDMSFDLAFSNSVIEHLGRWSVQQQFAAEIRRIAPAYFVQTPDRRFPVEPHLITPCIHWLPHPVQRRLLRNFTVWGLITRPSVQRCDVFMNEISLLNASEMQALFPDSAIVVEKMAALPKSIIAVRKPQAGLRSSDEAARSLGNSSGGSEGYKLIHRLLPG